MPVTAPLGIVIVLPALYPFPVMAPPAVDVILVTVVSRSAASADATKLTPPIVPNTAVSADIAFASVTVNVITEEAV